MDFEQKYNEIINLINVRIDGFGDGIESLYFSEPFNYLFESGGKRIRAVLTYLSCGALGGKPYDAINSAVAIEFIHNFTLVHDDIMDKSEFRRGRKTIYKQWDDSRAILFGDVLIGYAYSLLDSNSISILNRGLIEVCQGQALDIDLEKSQNCSVQDYLTMVEKKTSSLLKTSVELGSVQGNASSEQITNIIEFAKNLGVAFQLQDDLLDLTSSTEKLGKKVGQDIVEGKRTYIMIRAKEKISSTQDKILIDKFYDNDGLAFGEVKELKEILKSHGILAETESLYKKYYANACTCLDKLPANEYTDTMKELCNKLETRQF